MEASVNKSLTLKSSKTPSQSGESDENSLKKPATKNFMSPTISAATKAAAATASRKKILAERNESSDFVDTKFDSTTWDIKPRFIKSSSSRLTPSQSFASVGDDDEDQVICGSDSSMKPYDPLTSYTSPRPKFLRYNPNRPHQQNETCKEDLGFDVRRRVCFDSQVGGAAEERAIADALDSVSLVCSSQESPRKEEIEIDKNEGNPDNNWGEEEDEDEIEEIEKERRWSLKELLKGFLVIVVLFLSTIYISSMNSPTPSPTVVAVRGLKNGYYEIQNKVFEAVNLKILEGFHEPKYRGVESNPVAELEENRVEDENQEVVESGETVEVENVRIGDLFENELEINREVFDEVTEIVDHELEGNVEGSDHLAGEGSDELLDAETVVGEEVVENETDIVEDEEFGISQRKSKEESDTNSLYADSKEAIIKSRKIESFPAYSEIAVPMFFTIFASFGLVYWWSHKNTSMQISSQQMEIESSATRCQEACSIPEKISPVLDVEQENKIKKVEFKAKPPVLIRSNEEEISEEFRQSQAPIVELLSELVIGEVNSSLKSKFLEIKESNNNYVSQEKNRSNVKQPSSSVEFSTADSPSYGSFTPAKKIAKKAKDEEVNMLTTTPVRRSSRIKNRAIMSP